MITRAGNTAKNQVEVYDEEGKHFFSYGSRVATIDGVRTILYEPYWNNFSATTNRYLLDFLNEHSIKDIRDNVRDGTYEVKE